MYLALDPGHTTGFATFNEKGDSTEIGEATSRSELYELLDRVHPDLIIMEDWITNPHITLGGDRLETVRVIGAVEHFAFRTGAKVIFQPNTVKSIAYKWAGIPKPKNKFLTHSADAYVHGVYYLQKEGIRHPQQGKPANA